MRDFISTAKRYGLRAGSAFAILYVCRDLADVVIGGSGAEATFALIGFFGWAWLAYDVASYGTEPRP